MVSLATTRHCLTALVALLAAACSGDYSEGEADIASVDSALRGHHGHGHRGDRDGHRRHGRHHGDRDHDRDGHCDRDGNGDGHHDHGHDWDWDDEAKACKEAAVDRMVGMCHATGDVMSPFVHITVSVPACALTHMHHEGDFISDDPTCGVMTCTPTSCDAAGVTCGVLPDGCGGEIDCGPCPTPNILPTTACGRGSIARGAQLLVDFSVLNDGTGEAPAGAGNDTDSWIGSFYLSTDADVTTADTLLGSFNTQPALPAGASWASAASLLIPSTLPTGTYFLALITDPTGVLPELNEGDNTLAYCSALNVTAGGGR